MESFEIEKYYEWTVTQRKGQVEIYLAEDVNNVYFKSGRFIQKELFESNLTEITESEYKLKSVTNKAYNDTVTSSVEQEFKYDFIPDFKNNELSINSNSTNTKEKSVVALILEKQKKINKQSLSVSYDINFPNDKAINFMCMMFDEEEVVEELAEYIIKQIGDTKVEIRDAIKNKINESLNNKINTDQTKHE